jgi:hypothetical protein
VSEPTTPPVFSRRQTEAFQPDGCPRTYHLAPLTFLERQEYRADMTRAAGPYPSDAVMLDALRAAIRELSPGNAGELLGIVDAYQATPDDPDLKARLASLEAVALQVPVYAEQRAVRELHLGKLPLVAARHALRGWEGDSLPPFQRIRGRVPDDLLEVLPEDELIAIGWRAFGLMQADKAAEGNSEAPSPSPSTPETSPAA